MFDFDYEVVKQKVELGRLFVRYPEIRVSMHEEGVPTTDPKHDNASSSNAPFFCPCYSP